MLRDSVIIRILKKKAREKVYSSGQIKEVAVKAASSYKRSRSYLSMYNYDILAHKMYRNDANALISKGCGCALCISRHKYVTAKDRLRKLKKSYYDDRLYFLFLKEYRASNTDKTEGSFFVERETKLTMQLEHERNHFYAIRETILEMLSA